MPVTFPEIIVGREGLALINEFADPNFLYTKLERLEELFVEYLKEKLELFKRDTEYNDIPAIKPAYNLTDRAHHGVIVEGAITQWFNRSLGGNVTELDYYPDPQDDTEFITYQAREGEVAFNIDIITQSPNRVSAIRANDWILAALSDPSASSKLKTGGVLIPLDSIRLSGKPRKITDPQYTKSALWSITISIGNIILPWARMYQMTGPDLLTITTQFTQDSLID